MFGCRAGSSLERRSAASSWLLLGVQHQQLRLPGPLNGSPAEAGYHNLLFLPLRDPRQLSLVALPVAARCSRRSRVISSVKLRQKSSKHPGIEQPLLHGFREQRPSSSGVDSGAFGCCKCHARERYSRWRPSREPRMKPPPHGGANRQPGRTSNAVALALAMPLWERLRRDSHLACLRRPPERVIDDSEVRNVGRGPLLLAG